MKRPLPRLVRPLVRDRNQEPSELRETTWDDALDRAASLIQKSVTAHGADTFGMFSCSKASNEVNYFAQKFARVAVGSNNIDSCNRT